MTKSPAFQFYPDDFMGGKAGMMTPEQTHVYIWLLCLDWNQHGFEHDVTALSRWCRVSPAVFRKAWAIVKDSFAFSEGKWFNERLQKEREKQEAWREKSAKGGSTKRQPPLQPKGNHPSDLVEECLQPEGNTPLPTPVSTTTTNSEVVVEMTEINRLVAAANLGAAEHVKPPRRQLIPRIIASTGTARGAVEDLVAGGVPLDFAERAIYEIASTCEPDGAVKSLRYYVGAVVRQWQKKQAADDMQSVGDEGPKLNDNGQKIYTSRYQSPAEIRELNEAELVGINERRVAEGREPLSYSEAYRGA